MYKRQAVGGAALLLGLAAGDLLFQALRAVMLALFGAPYRVSLAFSPPAVGLTLVYFLFIYLFALLKGRRRIRRMKIRELIYLDRRNEEEVIEKSRSRRRIFVLSVILGAVDVYKRQGQSLLLADEPTGALDSKASKNLLEIMTRMNRDMGATILMVTHDAYSASYAARVLFLKDGRLFHELLRGERGRPVFYHEILDVLALLGGDVSDVI